MNFKSKAQNAFYRTITETNILLYQYYMVVIEEEEFLEWFDGVEDDLTKFLLKAKWRENQLRQTS